jgi:hypothetical protein
VKAQDWEDALLAEHRNSMYVSGGRDAYDFLTQAAQGLVGYECAPGWQGEVRIFKYTDPSAGERPFAFIVNVSDLLFYVRKAGFVRVPGGLGGLRSQFPSTKENPAGEWTIRITNAAEAQALAKFLFPKSNP